MLDALRRIVHELHRSHREAEQRWRVSAAQLLVLQRLAESPAASVNELAERTYTHQSTVSVVVSRLAQRGLVRRHRSADDARRTELALTPAGLAMHRDATTVASVRLIDALESLAPTELRAVRRCLSTLTTALGDDRRHAPMFFEEPATRPARRPRTAVARQA